MNFELLIDNEVECVFAVDDGDTLVDVFKEIVEDMTGDSGFIVVTGDSGNTEVVTVIDNVEYRAIEA